MLLKSNRFFSFTKRLLSRVAFFHITAEQVGTLLVKTLAIIYLNFIFKPILITTLGT